MKTLVTGATGFMGSSIVRELLKDGVEVKVLVRENSNTRNIEDMDVEKVYGDIRDGESIKAALHECDTLYQTAALYSRWMPDIKVFYDINVAGTKTALYAALEKGVEKVVYTSTVGTIGAHGAHNFSNENAEFNLWGTGNHYIRSKYLGELEAKRLCEKGLPLVIVNPAIVIGARDIRPTPSGQTILNVLNGNIKRYIDAGMNIIDVEDAAQGHILAAQKGRIGERYILGNQNLSIIEYYELIEEVSGVEPPRRRLPYPLALLLSYSYQLVSRITKKPPALTPSMVRTGGAYAYFDCSKAVNELGLPQTPVRVAIEKAVSWFRENGYVKGV